jgi:Protein of unknown function DUF262/HNH endonuclease
MVTKELSGLHPIFGEQSIDQLLLLHESGRIKLDPGFQRNSVWQPKDRRSLIESVLQGYPLPCIFLYRRHDEGKPIYEVIDGKQRLETVLMFVRAKGFRNKGFDLRIDLGEGSDWQNWKSIQRYYPDAHSNFNSFKIQTVEVTGDLNKIVELFLRINSTGKSLTTGEKRNAKFYKSAFLKVANRLVAAQEKYLLAQKILSRSQIDRMKGVELFSELLISIEHRGIINKKKSLDITIGNEKINGNTLRNLTQQFTRTLGLVKKLFPNIGETRFKNSAEFYSLFMLVWEMDQERFVFADRARNNAAFAILTKLSTEVDKLRTQLRKATPGKIEQRVIQDYLLTVQGDTDSGATRDRRRQILKGLLWSIFERKDEKRVFTLEQRRILWGSEDNRVCPKCRKAIDWNDVSVDHILAYTRGGKTDLRNAQLMHKSCNSRKGAS